MKILKNIVIATCLLMFILSYQNTEAQNVAQEANTIFQQSCILCHGENGYAKDELLLEHTVLIDSGVVIPGDPENSELYKRLLGPTPNGEQMPLNQDALSQESIDTIARWIAEGAPDWNVQLDVDFITTDTLLDTIQAHLATLAQSQRPFARYFTLTHLYNAGESQDTLNDNRIALSKMVNSLSWGGSITNPKPIDTEETILYIDLRNYNWDVGSDNWEIGTDPWTQIEQVYPYRIEFNLETQADLLDKLTNLRQEMDCQVPYIHVDWFLATASLPPLYNDILGLPETDRELEDILDVDVAENIQTHAGTRVWRAGFNDSGVSNHNRVVERHTSQYGAYWKSYDFAGSVDVQNIFTYPLSFRHDGGEIIFNLPNGLQAYFLVDAEGNRLDVAPTDIVSNPAVNDPAVRNGLSCIGCHSQGMREFEDQVRAVIEQADNPSYDKGLALLLYPEQSVLDGHLQKDTNKFLQALIEIGGPFDDDESKEQFLKKLENEPIQRLHEVFQGPLYAPHAAASVGLETDAFLEKINAEKSLGSLDFLLVLTIPNGTVQRDAWTSNFDDVISWLYDSDSRDDQDGRDDRDDLIAGNVYIPDVNLRTVLEEILNIAHGTPINVEDMKRLMRIDADERGISDLTGLQFATNLQRIEFRHNSISDLSPLKDLTTLNNIKLRGNQITDVTPLANLTKVDWLGLEQNQISDLSPLKNLKKLQGVGLTGNPVTDVSPLADLTSLQRIDAWRTPVSDFSVLKSLPRLSWIEYGNDRLITELPSMEGLTSLTRLEIHGCTIPDLTALSKMNQLQWLELVNNGISDLKPLQNLKNLTTLNLDANIISDVTPLSGLTRLKVLYLENNVISDVSSLSGLSNLERLDLRNNAITNFSFIDSLSQKTFVRTVGNPGFPAGGSKITGPWLWAIVPGTRLDEHTDFLARATNSAATEEKVATNGAVAGKAVGDSTWTWHSLHTTGNNINQMTESLGWGTGSEIYDHIVYGSVILDSPSEQQTRMFVGSDDSVKVWLNGELVHKVLSNRGGTNNYEDFFPVTLKQGQNALLVAIDNHGHGGFSGYFGFAPDAKYSVFRAGTRFVFDTDATSFEVEDTFTLNLKTENVRNLAGWQADLVFNPDVLEAVEVSEGDFLMSEDEETRFSGGTIDNETGKITSIYALPFDGGVSGNGTLCSVSFNVIGTGECLLTLENFEAGSGSGQPLPSLPPEYIINVEGEEPTRPPWDVNQDGIVNILDLIQVAQFFNSDVSENPQADVNGDGVINILDLITVAQNFGKSTASAPIFVAKDNAELTPAMVEAWIKQAIVEDDGSIVFQQGIANLQKLLETIVVPEKTVLLTNYPNPFNPETWIPYQLAESAEVNLTIYNANGLTIRSLELGQQAAGIYRSRGRAAYWDGRNEFGESVASGIYFYTFTAGDFTATRKMLLMK